MWFHVDINNFYVSAERVFQPKYNNRPVVVLSNNDGCAISRSDEAKALKIPMGAVYFQWEKFFQENDVAVFSSNYILYGDLSHRVMQILESFTPELEIYSIDEAFGKLDGFSNKYDKDFEMKKYCLEIKRRMLKWLGLPVSIGIGPTKALAKMATRVAKKFPEETKGVHLINTEELRIKALRWLEVGDIWGIGRQYAKLLEKNNVRTALDFTELPDDWVSNKMSIVELRLQHDLRGIRTLDFEKIQKRKNIGRSRSFDKAILDLDGISERLASCAVKVANELRKQETVCKGVSIYITTGNHAENPISRKFSFVLDVASNCDIELNKYCQMMLKIIYKPGYIYKKAGVNVYDLVPENEVQLNLFAPALDEKRKVLMKTMDNLKSRYGQNCVKLARQPKEDFKMRRNFLSREYTTKLSDILKVTCF